MPQKAMMLKQQIDKDLFTIGGNTFLFYLPRPSVCREIISILLETNICAPPLGRVHIMDAILVLSNGNPPWPFDLSSVSGLDVLHRHAQHHLPALFR